VAALALTTVALGEDVAAALRAVPAGGGVGQILGPDGRNLLIGRAADLRRWAGTYFGLGPPPKPGVRPRTNLTGLAVAVAFAETASEFGQRLRYERLMARYVPPAQRKDLKPPSWLALDPAERFPRVLVRDEARAAGPLYGPFRDRAAAARARDLLYKRFQLRPCDYAFEPDPELPLGLGCLYAQVRTCAAPCLARVGEDAYRALAGDAARFLADPAERGDALPAWIRPLAGQRALVAERTRGGWELFALHEGHVVDDAAADDASLERALGALDWEAPASADDRAWVTGWLHAPKRKGAWHALPDADLARRVRDASAR
jgi:excinuclease ABC subunit C